MNIEPPTSFVCCLRRTEDTRKLFTLKRSVLDLDRTKVEWIGRGEGNTRGVLEWGGVERRKYGGKHVRGDGGGRNNEVGREIVA